MNRRQRRALVKKFPGYKKLLNEAKEKTFAEFQEMLEKRWEEQAQKQAIAINSDTSATPQQQDENRDNSISE